ncbi:MAG: glycosyltransferase [Mogibacterium sp.]|nr:glycosyltransferase [Mogibacterium sp.]
MNYDNYSFPKSSRQKFKELMLSIPDLKGVHVHDLATMVYPLYLADRLGFPIKVIQCHTARSKSVTNNLKKSRSQIAKLNLIKGNQFDRFACSDLSGLYDFPGLSYEIMPNAVDIDRFTYNKLYRSLVRQKLGIKDSSTVIGSVGNVYYVKKPLFSIEIFHRFHLKNPDSYYFVLGSGNMLNNVRDYAKENGISDRVFIFGSRLDIDIYYNAMDIVIQPSASEGLPNSLVEAQTSGLPCLVSDEISDMVRLTPLIRFMSLSEDAESWANELASINNSRGERREWRKEIKSAGYDIKDVSKTLMNLYLDRIHQCK